MAETRQGSVTRRIAILKKEGLIYAPNSLKRAFWSRQNWRRSRPIKPLGVLAAKIVSDDGLRAARRLALVRSVWEAVVPREFAALCDVESLRGGRLLVRVDGKATQFVLSRSLGATLASAMNERLGNPRIDRIDYRVGSATR